MNKNCKDKDCRELVKSLVQQMGTILDIIESLGNEVENHQKWMAAFDNRLMDLSEDVRKIKMKGETNDTSTSSAA